MKNLLLTATFVLASFSSFAANTDSKSNDIVVPVKNTIEVVTNAVEKQKEVTCTVEVNVVFASFSVSWCCAGC
jgi:hypothetical protein